MGDTIDPAVIAPALREHKIRPDDTVAIFASGSMVRGWANQVSDLDVHVITEQVHESSVGEKLHVALEPPTLQYERIHVDGRRWDIEYWTQGQVDQLLSKVSWAAYQSPDAPWATLARPELGMLERLPYAVAADGAGWLEQVRQQLAGSAHRTILIGLSLREADGLIEDAAGQVEAGDHYSAVIAARMAFAHTVDALQASLGQFGSLWPKWRARRMSLIDSPLLSFAQYWQLESMAGYAADDPAAWVTEVLEACRRIAMELEI